MQLAVQVSSERPFCNAAWLTDTAYQQSVMDLLVWFPMQHSLLSETQITEQHCGAVLNILSARLLRVAVKLFLTGGSIVRVEKAE